GRAEGRTMSRLVALDGNEAAARVAYAASEVIAIYPITPASAMGELADSWAAAGRAHTRGAVPSVDDMQSGAGGAGAMHRAAQARPCRGGRLRGAPGRLLPGARGGDAVLRGHARDRRPRDAAVRRPARTQLPALRRRRRAGRGARARADGPGVRRRRGGRRSA